MRKFVQSGGAFMVVALLCFATGVLSDKGAMFIGVGAFWLVMAIGRRCAPPPMPNVGRRAPMIWTTEQQGVRIGS